MSPLTITICKYIALGLQVGIVGCGAGIFVWHMLRLVGVINDEA